MFHLKNWRFGVSSLHRAGNEALVRDCFDFSAIPTFLVSLDDTLVYANRAFGDLLGYDPPQCAGLKFDAIVHPDDIGAARALAGGTEARQIKSRYLRQNGEIVWVQASVSTFRGKRGQTPYCIVQAVDIDRQKRIEAELASVESRWNFVLESGGHGFWDRDLKNDRHFYSPVWKRMRGIDLADPVHDAFNNWFSRVHPDDQDRMFHEVHEPGYGNCIGMATGVGF
jgi:PAS domain S-box-containing protein